MNKRLRPCGQSQNFADLMIAYAAPGGPGTNTNTLKTNFLCHVPAVAAAGATFH